MSASSSKASGLRAAFSKGFHVWMERQSRANEIARLEAMTDSELAGLGIRRDRIYQHVFRDVFAL